MSLTNYRDISTWATDSSAGFQFEFYCARCDNTWRSPFKPYRVGQFAALLSKVESYFSSAGDAARLARSATDHGSGKVKDGALQDAIDGARGRFHECEGCGKTVCGDCWNDRSGACNKCSGKAGGAAASAREQGRSDDEPQAAAHACPSCGTASDGGRFCAECGFDMASSFKSCPACGAMASRDTQYCGDCGHGF